MRSSCQIPGSDDGRAPGRHARRRTLVLGDGRGSGLLAGRSCRIADRVLARVLGARLDRQLAAGRSPDSARLLAARAQHLVSAATRQALAEHWEHLVQIAGSAPGTRPGRTPALCRDRIVTAEPEVHEMVALLRTPLPVAARGIAAASVLLTDGAGPVYNRRARPALREALRRTAAQLDPSMPLFASP